MQVMLIQDKLIYLIIDKSSVVYFRVLACLFDVIDTDYNHHELPLQPTGELMTD